jgi:hypothetical protein
MAKFSDWSAAQDVKDIAERFAEHFPGVFEGFDTDGIFFFLTKKKNSKCPIRVKALGYPAYVAAGKPYIIECFERWWTVMDARQKNIAVFDAMSSIPDGGFDESSKHYGKLLQPDIKMQMRTFAATGGIPNWFENPAAKDPMERTPEEVAEDIPTVEPIPTEDEGDGTARTPVTTDDIANVGADEAAA